jgi:serine/threonine protein kinase
MAKRAARNPFEDSIFLRITRLLELSGKPAWSLRPRTYAVLRMINRVDIMDSFVTGGLYDISFPYSEKTLPDVLRSPAARSKFLELQPLVLATQAADVESGKGRHRHFAQDGDIHFKRIKQLGKGGFGEVDHVFGRLSFDEFARKRIPRGKTFQKDKMAILDFVRELEILKRLSHRHLVKYIGSYTDPKYIGIIMSPVADSNLAQFLEASPFPTERFICLRRFYGCLSSALLYLHENKIRHKDVKPLNILVHGDNILITDFGTSFDWTDRGHSTTSNIPAGPRTLAYCSPEVCSWEVSCITPCVPTVRAMLTGSSIAYLSHAILPQTYTV